MKKRIYKAAPGAMFPARKAQRIGEAIAAIGETVTPEDVVRAAKNRKSPLHEEFEWNVRKAAESHWLHHARNILNHINVVVTTPNGAQKEIKAFYSQIVIAGASNDDEPSKERRYLHISVVEREPQSADDVIENAKAELEAWKERYRDYRDYFAPVVAAIEKIVKPKRRPTQATAARRTGAK